MFSNVDLWHEHRDDQVLAKQLLDGDAKNVQCVEKKLRALFHKRQLAPHDAKRDGDRLDLEEHCGDAMRIDEAIERFAIARGLTDHVDSEHVDVRLVGLTSGLVSRGSIDARQLGHPFLDALYLAHRSECNMVLSPLMLWELISESVVLAVRSQYAALRSLSNYQHKAAGAADGCFRMALTDLAIENEERDDEARLCDSAWPAVRDQLLDAIRRMAKMLRYVDYGGVMIDSDGYAATSRLAEEEPIGKMARLDAGDDTSDVRISPTVSVRVDGKLNRLPPINMLLERLPLPLPDELVARSEMLASSRQRQQNSDVSEDDDDDDDSQGDGQGDRSGDGESTLFEPFVDDGTNCLEFRSRVAGYYIKGTLEEWSLLFNGVADLAEYPEFDFWCTRILWILYHILR